MGKGDKLLNISVNKLIKPLSLLGFIGLSALTATTYLAENTNQDLTTHSYILTAKNSIADYELLKKKISELNVTPTHSLAIIDAVAVDLTDTQLNNLQQHLDINITENHKVELSGGLKKGQRRWQPLSAVNDLIDASAVHSSRNFGDNVTIGFLDTGLDQLEGLAKDLYGRDKAWGTYDAVNNSVSNYDDEASGHGTHVASIAGNSDFDIYGKIYGVAPNAALVGIKAFDAEGKATYADVIRGIDWALQVKDQINLRVLNMSFSGPVRSNYWDDPLNQAVMKAWQAGVVVVASAGNKGPDPMTIGVPGNVPYIITVGAMTDSYTSASGTDDKLATFSAAGPTYEAFVKPEIVAPGGHLSGLMSYDTQIVMDHPEFHDGGRYFEMSGTSQAAAVVSGVVALMLTQDPSLTPDQVKCRLMDSAHSARKENGELAYSVFQQGAGVVNAYDALSSNAMDCANTDLDLVADLAGEQHFSGTANMDAQGNFYIEGLGEEYVWKLSSDTEKDTGYVWQPNVEVDRLVWKTVFEVDRLVWKTFFEVDRLVWKTSVDFNSSETINVNNWVKQQ